MPLDLRGGSVVARLDESDGQSTSRDEAAIGAVEAEVRAGVELLQVLMSRLPSRSRLSWQGFLSMSM